MKLEGWRRVGGGVSTGPTGPKGTCQVALEVGLELHSEF